MTEKKKKPKNNIEINSAAQEKPEQLVSYVKQFYSKKGIKPERIVTEQTVNYLQKIIILIRAQTGIDFSQYKQSTIIRRIERRMSLHQIKNISDYVRYLGVLKGEGTYNFFKCQS